MKYLFFLLKISFFALLLTGCTEFSRKKDVPLPENAVRKMVLQADLPSQSPEKNFVFLTRTNGAGQYINFDFNVGGILYRDTANPRNNIINGVTDPFTITFDTVRGAKVSLFRNDTFLTDIKRSITDPNGVLRTDENLAPFTEGSTYKIRVTAPNFETIEAEQKVSKFIPAKKITYTKGSYTKSDGQRLSEIFIEFDDPPSSEDYYSVSVVTQSISGNLSSLVRSNRDIFTLDPLATSALTINDRGFNGQKYTWRIGTYYYGGDIYSTNINGLYVTFRTVNKDFETYRRSVELIEKIQNNPYVEPYSIYTNVKNGYGLFNISGKATTVYIPLK